MSLTIVLIMIWTLVTTEHLYNWTSLGMQYVAMKNIYQTPPHIFESKVFFTHILFNIE